MPHFRITISNPSDEAMADLVRIHNIQVSDHGIRHSEATGYVVDAIVQEDEIEMLENAGYHVERHEDLDEAIKLSRLEVNRSTQYKRPDRRTKRS